MADGWWLRIEDGKAFEVYDHAMDFYGEPSLAKKMGNMNTFKQLHEENLVPERTGQNREEVVKRVMDDGFIRVREHGHSVTFEFIQRPQASLDAIFLFGVKHFGPMTDLLIVQINRAGATIDSASMNWSQFKETYAEDTSKILRTAGEEDEDEETDQD
jgi:hypothetical protein